MEIDRLNEGDERIEVCGRCYSQFKSIGKLDFEDGEVILLPERHGLGSVRLFFHGHSNLR